MNGRSGAVGVAVVAALPLSLGVVSTPAAAAEVPAQRMVRSPSSLTSSPLGKWLDGRLDEVRDGIRSKLHEPSTVAASPSEEDLSWFDIDDSQPGPKLPGLRVVEAEVISGSGRHPFSVTGDDFDAWYL